jgi:DNA end-binding protein Ku
MASTYTAWRGALDLGGFPVNVALYSRTKSQRSESFRILAPDGQPRIQQYVDTAGNVLTKDECRQAVEVSKGQFVPLTDEAVELINDRQRSTVLEPEAFVPTDTLPLDLAITTYAVRADDKVPGADRSVNVVWNGLRASELAYVTKLTPRAGSVDSILVVYATTDGLWAATLPFAAELYEVPPAEFVTDDQQASVFETAILANQTVQPFDHSQYVSEYRTRRQAAIDAALSGEQLVAPVAPQASQVPDLMAALSASISTVTAKTKPARTTKTPAKPKAPVKA